MPRKYTPEQHMIAFWAKVDRSAGPDGCWLWTAASDKDGYGFFKEDGKQKKAHRVSWAIAHGPIPEGMLVCHNCPAGDTPACVNPAHLFLDTNDGNMRDMAEKGRAAHGEDHPARLRPETRPRGTRHPLARLTPDLVAEARRRRASGESYGAIARSFGISSGAIHGAVTGRTWREVDDGDR